MAVRDYRSCDVCGCKTFYDAGLNYNFGDYPKHGLRLGDWKVICESCSDKYKVVIVNKESGKIYDPKAN